VAPKPARPRAGPQESHVPAAIASVGWSSAIFLETPNEAAGQEHGHFAVLACSWTRSWRGILAAIRFEHIKYINNLNIISKLSIQKFRSNL
jgi:hypothetical protein